MSFEFVLLSVCFFGFVVGASRLAYINAFKIAYYEQKLENRGVDISHIKKIRLRDILKPTHNNGENQS